MKWLGGFFRIRPTDHGGILPPPIEPLDPREERALKELRQRREAEKAATQKGPDRA